MYGDWLDVHVVAPRGPRACRVTFDYFLRAGRAGPDADGVEAALVASRDVQMEDVGICRQARRDMTPAGT